MEINLIAESVKFLILGMSTVFMFLVLMVFVLELQSKIIMKFFPPKKEEESTGSNSTSELSRNGNLAVVAAIAASLKSYKQSK
jgi:oxaloacetate decarboxylase gamma subunit